jgi:hypothetical protein
MSMFAPQSAMMRKNSFIPSAKVDRAYRGGDLKLSAGEAEFI